MLSPQSQVILRNVEWLEQGHWALVNPADSAVFAELKSAQVSGFHQYFDVYKASQQASPESTQVFAAAFVPGDLLDGAVVYMPKAKAHCKMLLANLAAHIKPGGQLLLVGENKGGIKSAAKLLEPFGERVNKVDSARHCSIFAVEIAQTAPAFDLDKWLQTHAIAAGGLTFDVQSLPGVFSHGELDAGTRLLLDNVASVPNGPVLDFACGAGIIGVYLALKSPGCQPVMSDVSALAVYCAKKTAELNKVNAQVIASDGLTEVGGKFAAIYTNPPFHTGIKTDYGITERFIRDIKRHMHKGASVTLVANRFLKYPDLLANVISQPATVAQTTKFNLYRCTSR